MRIWVRRHVLAFDLRAITSREHRAVVQGGLNALDARMYRVRRATGRRIPVTVRDLSQMVAETPHDDAHPHGNFHVLTDPEARHAALGLYWLPTRAFPAGRIELHEPIMVNVPLAQEVLIAEAAHAYDLTVMTEAQRLAVWAVMHGGDATPHSDHGWWEERGSQNYWAWGGEAFMGLFCMAFAPTLPLPLHARQPWVHKVDDAMAAEVRRLLG